MPKSRRVRKIHLTKTEKKGREVKAQLIDQVQTAVDEFDRCFVFSYDNMRSNLFKDLRRELADCRFFLGKNKVIQVALGDTKEAAFRPGTSDLAQHLAGNVGLLFTNRTVEDLQSALDNFIAVDYARPGYITDTEVILPAGVLDMPHTMVEPLKRLGLPIELNIGKVVLQEDFLVCSPGDCLNHEQTRILKLFAKPLAQFTLNLLKCWSDGKVVALAEG